MKTLEKNSPKIAFASSVKPLRICPSRCYLWCVCSAHLLALVAVWLTSLAFVIQCLLCVFLLLHLKYCVNQWRATPVYRMVYRHEHWCLLANSSQQQGDYTVIHGYLWSRYLLVVVVENSQQQRRYFPIVFDSCSQDEFRCLRVAIKTI